MQDFKGRVAVITGGASGIGLNVAKALAAEGIQAAYPKEVFRRAFEAGWLSAEAPWLAMLADCNLIARRRT